MRFFRRNRSKVPVLGALEIDVLQTLWSTAEPVDARRIRERLTRRAITLSTVQATVERLCRKELAAREKIGRAYFYSAAIGRESLISMLIRDMSERVTGGELEPVISGFIDLIGESDPSLLDRLESNVRRRRKDP